MIPPLTRAEVESLPDRGPFTYQADADGVYRVWEADGTPAARNVQAAHSLGRLAAAAPSLRATALALYAEVEALREAIADREADDWSKAGPIPEAPPMSGALGGGNREIVNAGTSGAEYGWGRR